MIASPVEGDEHRHHPPSDRLPDPHCLGQPVLQREGMADPPQLLEVVGSCENASGSGEDEVVLAVEDPEDRPFGHPGGGGEVLGGYVEPPLEDEWQGGLDERSPARLGGQSRGSGRLLQGRHHSGTIGE